jgi:hypothetical protein
MSWQALSMAAGAAPVLAASDAPQLMFVQRAADLKVDAAKSTFRLVQVNRQGGHEVAACGPAGSKFPGELLFQKILCYHTAHAKIGL